MATNVRESTSGRSSFECNICFELPQEPIVTLCGHLFCWPCLCKWLRIHSHSPKCPVCKAAVKEDKLVLLYGSGKDRVDPRSKNNVPGDVADITYRPTGQRPTMAQQAGPNRRPLTSMKIKRRRLEGDDTSTAHPRSDDPPQLEVRNQHTEGTTRSIYVVVNIWDTRPVYSIYKMDCPYHSCSLAPKRQRLHPLATLEIEGSRTFVSVQTRCRKWIVAVGSCHTIVFDTETEDVIHGPKLINGKECPVLVAVEDKIYALSTFPKVKGKLDFEPWFEVLDLSQATVIDGCLDDCTWEELPSPPCFPCQLDAQEFFCPPVVIVESYVVVGSYILMSIRSDQHTTYAFDTVSAKWHKVHGSKCLPFIGCPTPQQHGIAGLYLGKSSQDNHRCPALIRPGDPVISAYSIKLTSCEKEDDIISITEFPIKCSRTCGPVTGLHYSSLDKGMFCSLDWKSCKRIIRSWGDDILLDEFHWSKKATITLKMYQMEDNSLLQEGEPVKIAISEQPEQAFKIRTKSGGFISPAFLAVFKT
ncbi:hypothetical protein ACQ4PT_047144 [Festuca glaucescens]